MGRSTKLGGTIRATYNMTHVDKWTRSRPELRRNGRKRPFLRFAEKRKTGRKSVFFQKKHQKSAKRLIFIWEKGTFSFAQLCPVVARTWLESRSVYFFWPQKFGFLPENPFFHMETCFFALNPG